jgi:hypothetical protein
MHWRANTSNSNLLFFIVDSITQLLNLIHLLLQEILIIERPQQRAPRSESDVFFFPLFQSPPTSRKGGNSLDEKRDAAPVRSAHKIPSRQARFDIRIDRAGAMSCAGFSPENAEQGSKNSESPILNSHIFYWLQSSYFYAMFICFCFVMCVKFSDQPTIGEVRTSKSLHW